MSDGHIRQVNPNLAAYAVMGLVERVSEIGGLSSRRIPIEERATETREMVKRALAP